MSSEAHPHNDRRPARRHGAVGAAIMMLGSSYCEILLGMIRGILVMNILGPVGRGIMRLVSMGHKYLSNSHLGALHGLSKELPLAIGREDVETVAEVESVAATWVLLTAILGGLGMCTFAWLMPRTGAPTKLSLMIGGAILITQQTYALYRVVLRAWGHFPILATASVISSLLQFALILAGAKLYGTVGAMLGWLLSQVITVGYFRFACRFAVPLRLQWQPLLRLVRVGLPLALIVFCDTLLRTVDGIVVVAKYSAYRFGVYSVAMQMSTYLYNIAESGGFVIMPRILEAYAAKGDVARLRREVLLPTFAAATVMPVAAGVAFILLPALIAAIVPRFVGCVFATQVLCLGSVLLALPVAANGLQVALNREFAVSVNKGAGAMVSYLLCLWVAHHNGSLRQIALAACAGYFVAEVMSLIEVLGRYCQSKLDLLWQLVLCHLPLAWCVVSLLLSGRLARASADPTLNDWWEVLARLGIFLLLMTPVVLYGNARTGILHELRRVAARLVGRRS